MSSASVTFRPGETEKTVVFAILEDEASEGNESVTFSLSDAQGGAVFMPATMNVAIQDDEPVEHSLVTFTDARYTAGSGAVNVTVERTGAAYSLVTARVRAVENSSAVQGRNFARTDVEIAFEPYAMEADLKIPVQAEPGKETEFALEIYDLKGGEDGRHTSAAVVIPAGPAAAAVTADGEQEQSAFLMAGEQEIAVPGFGRETYQLQDAGNDSYKIMDVSKVPWQEAGMYFLPTNARMQSWTNFGDTCSTWTNSYADGKRTMRWYSRLSWDEGGTKYVTRLENSQNYRQIFLDYSTHTRFSSNKHGFSFNVWGPEDRAIVSKSYEVGGTNDRAVRGAQVMYTNALDKKNGSLVGYNKGKLVPPYWHDDAAKNDTTLTIYAKKTAHGCIEPDMNVYGILAMYRQYRISLEKPDKLKYIRAGADGQPVVVEDYPANVYLAQGHDVRYPYQQIAVTDTALNTGDPIGGTLVGYYIKPGGTRGNGYAGRPQRRG